MPQSFSAVIFKIGINPCVDVPDDVLASIFRSANNKEAFDTLAPSRQKEISRYLHAMKTEESLDRNIEKVMRHLLGKPTIGLNALMRR